MGYRRNQFWDLFLFLIYINDLDDDITSKVLKFPDDCLGKLKVMQIDSIYKIILIS